MGFAGEATELLGSELKINVETNQLKAQE